MFDDSMVKWGYTFVRCPRCRRKLKIRIGQKSRYCPFCQKQVKLK